ncbi:MAG: hypothetical protein A3C85_00085 [Candidatus Doudnabacteria bacterium RIFCSPHIGHO2_02_FULL_48_21]|nr:MAG: hypothetical protein A3K05_02865 [Candidatus Doudnabacteria bacterium RIFCSPHIGHO2_01_48_18]OGE78906.1 MAG: hypothetical protein A2668_00835 [Candidatus Doudnabacteria bacterium RIFCSPHIGHO2_01_FULL_48_180]OGE90947.1 MAG: hypothetical protein A3F44_00355 [Candidatus Doudnabacteria bacterium RIFCSPHIGHO2_12_FULL_47_25]OGE94183.1 MAG: hypothetical protein A3C85_00085 [Candidatus Doudnabacteria bacterium RIFCSPHIGHO2_02_FULL_48_21]OGE98160.1 MAG: hypothetical protein A3A83_03240 [Candidatu
MVHEDLKILDPNFKPPLAQRRVSYGNVVKELQYADLRYPATPGPWPVVAMIHGGFWKAEYDMEHAGHLCHALTKTGLATWNIEYRRIGNGGGWPTTFEDIIDAMNYLGPMAEYYPLDLNKVVVLGHSAGGHLALWLAGARKYPDVLPETKLTISLKGVVSLAGVADLQIAWEKRLSNGIVKDFLGGSPDEVPERYGYACPLKRLPADTRQILIHGEDDTKVPVGLSMLYKQRAMELQKSTGENEPVELRVLDNCGHFELIDPEKEQFAWVRQAIADLI